MKIAIIGSGISGLTCAHYLKNDHEVDVYEKNDRLGGHTNTVATNVGGRDYHIDTGFIVFNDRTYPNFERLLNELNIGWRDTEMSFSVCNQDTGFEYNGHNLNTLFSQRKNIFSPRFYGFIRDILDFNEAAKQHAASPNTRLTLGEFVKELGLSDFFGKHYLLPMVAAIWSCSLERAQDFPLNFFLKFFLNHGLLDIRNRPQWRVIEGGSSSYIPALVKDIENRIYLDTPILGIRRELDQIQLRLPSETRSYDHIILACHSDEALALLDDASKMETDILGSIKYQPNDVTLHTDKRLMPKHRRSWASWNVAIDDHPELHRKPARLTYYMNRLQSLEGNQEFFVSLNSNECIAEEHILQKFNYCHPVISTDMVHAQQRWKEISGVGRTHFCGAYWRNGFHEDGVVSALNVCQMLRDGQ